MLMRITSVVLVSLLIAVSAGCGGDDTSTNPKDTDDNSNVIPSELVATWAFQSATVDGISASLADVLLWGANTVSARMTINSNGTYVYEEQDDNGSVEWSESNTFSVSDDSFTMRTASPYFKSGTWAISEDRLTLTVIFAGHTIAATATK